MTIGVLQAGGSSRRFVLDPPASRLGALKYGFAMLAVAGAFGALALAFGSSSQSDTASETADAVLVDLPPLEAAAQPPGADAPQQAAAPAAVGRTVTPPEPTPPAPIDVPPPPAAPDPAAVLPRKAEPPKPIAAPASVAQAAQAPVGAQTLDKAETDEAEAAKARAAHRITIWQRALMTRLEVAKRTLGRAPHSAGTVRVAFAIDAAGRLIADHVAQSSGVAALDAAALTLVMRAAPFPTPPAGTDGPALSFVVPIRFR